MKLQETGTGDSVPSETTRGPPSPPPSVPAPPRPATATGHSLVSGAADRRPAATSDGAAVWT